MGIDIQFMSPYLYPIFRQRSAGSTLSFVVSEDEDTFGFPEDFSNTLHISPSECKYTIIILKRVVFVLKIRYLF